MVSGDHVETAMAVAYNAGILDKDVDETDLADQVMTGEQFRAKIGPCTEKFDPNTNKFIIDFEDKA